MKRWKKIGIAAAVIVVSASLLVASFAVASSLLNPKEDINKTEQVGSTTLEVRDSPTPVKEITAQDVIDGVNAERVKAGLGALAVNEALNKSACMKADDMLSKNYWSHNSPDGIEPWYWFNKAGYNYRNAGENQAYNQNTTDALIQNWMNSEAHKANILRPVYKETGVCVRKGSFQGIKYTNLIVNHFGER